MSTPRALHGPDWLKTGVIVVAGLYFLRAVFTPTKWDLLDSFTLIVHEAGHPLFGLFGEFLGVAGGTLIQLIVPAAFIVSFLRQGQPFSSALMWLWLGNSLLYCSVYSGDAVAQALPLFGAGDRIHDWNYLLGTTNLLWATPIVSGGFRLLGALAILVGCFLGLTVAGVRLPMPAAPREPAPRRPRRPMAARPGRGRRGFRRPEP